MMMTKGRSMMNYLRVALDIIWHTVNLDTSGLVLWHSRVEDRVLVELGQWVKGSQLVHPGQPKKHYS